MPPSTRHSFKQAHTHARHAWGPPQAREELGFRPEAYGLSDREASNIAYAFAVSLFVCMRGVGGGLKCCLLHLPALLYAPLGVGRRHGLEAHCGLLFVWEPFHLEPHLSCCAGL